ncbi:MAG: DUF4160 domain-containing protein [Candidatus Saccharimonadales bacterium]
MYYGDHPPPHFHVTSPDGSVKMTIRGQRILAGSLPRRTLREAVTWASGNENELMERWRKLSEVDDRR